jgi:hypothetical protein
MNDVKLSHLHLGETMIADPDQLRELAAWCRKFANKAGASAIWEQRLLTAEALERNADEIDYRASAHRGGRRLSSGGI